MLTLMVEDYHGSNKMNILFRNVELLLLCCQRSKFIEVRIAVSFIKSYYRSLFQNKSWEVADNDNNSCENNLNEGKK